MTGAGGGFVRAYAGRLEDTLLRDLLGDVAGRAVLDLGAAATARSPCVWRWPAREWSTSIPIRRCWSTRISRSEGMTAMAMS